MRLNPVAEPQRANWWILSALAFGLLLNLVDGRAVEHACPPSRTPTRGVTTYVEASLAVRLQEPLDHVTVL